MGKTDEKTKEKLENERGITLVALTVMVIILLILGGITIGALNGEDGVLNKTLSNKKQIDVQNGIEIIKSAMIECNTLKPNSKMQASDLEEALSDYDVEVTPRGNNFKITLNGIGYRILPTGEVIQYDYMEPTAIYYKLDEDGTLRLKAYDPNYTKGTGWTRTAVTKVIIEEPIAPKNVYRFFYGCTNLKEFENIENLHTENMTSFVEMFQKTKLVNLNLKYFETFNVTTMSTMFYLCSSLENLNLDGFDTSKVTNMNHMFRGCIKLKKLDLSNFDTSQVTSMLRTFQDCESLTELDLKSFNTEKVTTMQSMFSQCYSLKKLDLSSFNTSNVTNMEEMFYVDKSLKVLDISNFDTSNVTDMSSMIRNCTNLTTIYASNQFTTENATDTGEMFTGSTKIKGGKGTTYINNSSTYARIDNPPDEPGYFTLKK